MKKAAHKPSTTTQRFTQIQDIIDNIVVLSGNQACMVLEVKPSNFSLLSPEDQEIKISAYAALLNSLSFPIQIVAINRKIDISSYLALLDQESANTDNQMLSQRIKMYKDFVSDLIQKNTVLEKKFYIAISFSFLESGALTGGKDNKEFAKEAKGILMSKVNTIIQGLARIGLSSSILEHDELINMYYEVYNSEMHKASSGMMPFLKK